MVETKPEGWFKEFTAQPTNAGAQEGPGRLATVNSSSRWLWWQEAWHAFEDQPGRGTGAGTFELTHRLLRTNNIVVTEPHNVPLQFLSETGIVGFLLLVAFLAAAGVGVVRAVRRLDGIERAAGVALAIVLGHLPAPLARGLRLGLRRGQRPLLPLRSACCWERSRAGGAAAVAGAAAGCVAVALALSLLTPWFAQRVTDAAIASLAAGGRVSVPARAGRPLAEPARARADFWQALALEQLGDFQGERQLYIDAVALQPLNWRAWLELGDFEARQQDSRARSRPWSGRSARPLRAPLTTGPSSRRCANWPARSAFLAETVQNAAEHSVNAHPKRGEAYETDADRGGSRRGAGRRKRLGLGQPPLARKGEEDGACGYLRLRVRVQQSARAHVRPRREPLRRRGRPRRCGLDGRPLSAGERCRGAVHRQHE